MSNLNRHPVRRTAAGVLASTLAFSGAFAAGTPAFAATGFELTRLAGDTRYETSAAIAAQFGAADGAILASGEAGHIVDALSASFLAGVREDPVLLTSRGMVSAEVLAQLNTLTSKNVTIVGGEAAVSEAVATQLRNAGFTVTRLAGADRYKTSEAVIRAAQAAASPIGILVSGQSPVDALAAGALAYKGKHPVFLTAGGTIPQATLDAMRAAGTRQIIIVGGTTVVPESVRAQLTAAGISVVTRLGGADRSATSRMVADYLIEKAGFSATTFNVASGANNGVDALSGAALSGKNNTVLLVTNTATDLGSVDDFAMARAATLTTTGRIFGGTAVVPTAVEEAIETAGGAGMANQVTLTSTSVAQGGTLTGTITGDNIQSVTVSGCGFTNQTIGDDDNTTMTGRQFTLNVGSGQATGSCNLTFTITPTGGGAAMTQTIAVNVTAAATSATVRPELVSAQVVSTTTSTSATPTNPVGTTVRYTFDESIANAGGLGPTANEFFVYTSGNTLQSVAGDPNATPPVVAVAGGRFDGDAVVSVDANSVTVRFSEVTTAEQAAELSVATVDDGAVRDTAGNTNPEGDAAVGTTTGGGSQALPAGITAAPDLMSVTGFRQGATAGVTAVDFTFDEAATTTDAGAFALVLLNGTELTGTGPTANSTTAGGGTVAGGNATTTITVLFSDADPNTNNLITAADIARGTVAAGTVVETANNETTSTTRETNVLQAADLSNAGNTTTPDLVSATFTQGENNAADTAIFTFDEAVTVTSPTNFFAYGTGAAAAPGTASTVSTDGTRVLVTFADTNALDRAVGASVTDGAVTGTNPAGSTAGDVNQQDEMGVANTTTAGIQTAGRTDAPDLMAVTLERGPNDPFGNPGNFRAVYTFDEDVEGVQQGNFYLFLADGTRLTATECAITQPTGTQVANDVDNTVTCTAYSGGTGTAAEQNAQLGSATLGTVDYNAVNEEGAGALTNPEGSDLTTGGTGTRTA